MIFLKPELSTSTTRRWLKHDIQILVKSMFGCAWKHIKRSFLRYAAKKANPNMLLVLTQIGINSLFILTFCRWWLRLEKEGCCFISVGWLNKQLELWHSLYKQNRLCKTSALWNVQERLREKIIIASRSAIFWSPYPWAGRFWVSYIHLCYMLFDPNRHSPAL